MSTISFQKEVGTKARTTAALEWQDCGARRPTTGWPICDCGGLLETVYDWDALRGWQPTGAESSRYDRLLPLVPGSPKVSLGEGSTPLIDAGDDVLLKCEHLNPTGSYKDRIASVAFSLGLASGAKGWIGTSSGNSGAAFAAYGARVGLQGSVFVVSSIPAEKLGQIEIFGATVHPVVGLGSEPAAEANVFRAVQQRARRDNLILGITARSYNPAAMDGAKVIAYEIVERLGRAPAAVYVPVGGGGLLASVWRGFTDLHRLGLISGLPRMVAVQAAGCAPIHLAFQTGSLEVVPVETSTSNVSGLQLTAPPDGRQALAALHESNGFSVAVADTVTASARETLARSFGVFVEPAAAIVYAGHQARPVDGPCVLLMTGSGFKAALQPRSVPVALRIRDILDS